MVTILNRRLVRPLYRGLKRLSVLPSSDRIVMNVNKSKSPSTIVNDVTTEDNVQSKNVKNYSEGRNDVNFDVVITPEDFEYRVDSSSEVSVSAEINSIDRLILLNSINIVFLYICKFRRSVLLEGDVEMESVSAVVGCEVTSKKSSTER